MGNCVGKLQKSRGRHGPEPQSVQQVGQSPWITPSAPPMPECAVYSTTEIPPRSSEEAFVRCLDGTNQQPTMSNAVRPVAPPAGPQVVGPPPAGIITVSGAAEFTAIPCNDAQKLLCLAHLTAPSAGDKSDDTRPPVTVSAVIDRSGSMSGEKLQLVQRTLHFVIRELRSEDRLGIIAYDDTVTEPLPLTNMTPQGKETASVAVDRIVPGGCTNLSGGLFAGLDQVAGRPLQLDDYSDSESRFMFGGLQNCSSRSQYGMQRMQRAVQNRSQNSLAAPKAKSLPVEKKPAELPPSNDKVTAPGGVSSVWLFTDGLANAGVQDTEGIVAGMKQRRPTDGTSVFTFGFGAQHNDSMLRNIAEYGHGMYYFIQDAASIPRAFAECLGGLLSVVAQNIVVTLTAPKGVRILRVLGQDNATLDDTGRHGTIILGDMYAEEQRDIIAELSVAPEVGVMLAEVSLNYAETPGGCSRSANAVIEVERPAQPPKKPLPPHPALDRQRNRLLVTQALRSARDEASGGRYEAACKILQQTAAMVTQSSSGGEDYCRELLDDLRACEEGTRGRSEWHAHGEKLNCNIEMGHRKQRSCGISAKGGRSSHMYSNRKQSAMVAEWCHE